MRYITGIILIFLLGCFQSKRKDNQLSKPYVKPKYINYHIAKDSIFAITVNRFQVPIHIAINSDSLSKQKVFVLQPKDSISILSFLSSEIDTGFISKNFEFKRYYGNPFLKKYDTLYRYLLPITRNKNYKVLQGYNGKYSHNELSSKYAIDFAMPIGDTIVAARDGIVLNLVEKYKKGGKNKKYYDFANSLLMYHKDGTFSQYVHLDYKGVLVEKGDTIKKGQVIALSGNTGWSTEPHLHFSVYKAAVGKLISIPVSFNGISGYKFKKGKRINY